MRQKDIGTGRNRTGQIGRRTGWDGIRKKRQAGQNRRGQKSGGARGGMERLFDRLAELWL